MIEIKNFIIIDNPAYGWNYGSELFDKVTYQIDVEKNRGKKVLSLNKGIWNTGLEHIQDSRLDVKNVKKLNIAGVGSFVTANRVQLTFEKTIMQALPVGSFIVALDVVTLYEKINDFFSIAHNAEKTIEQLNIEIKKMKENAKKNAKENIKDQQEIKKKRQQIRELKKAFSVSSFVISMFEFNFLIRNFTPVLITKNVLVFQKDGTNIVNKEKLEKFFSVWKDTKEQKITENELLNYINFFDEASYIYKIPYYFNNNHLEMFTEEDDVPIELDKISNNKDIVPLSPVKPTIVASMLASGAGGSLNKSIELNGEPCLIKSVIAPVEITEKVKIEDKIVETKTSTWSPQIGVFNKLRKELNIITE